MRQRSGMTPDAWRRTFCLLTVVGLIVLLLFAGELSLAVGPVIGVAFAMVILVAALLVMGWRRRSRG